MSWYSSNFGYNGAAVYTGPNFFQMLQNGNVVGSAASLVLVSGWFAQSLSFVAASTSDQIAFQLGGAGPSYLGIDGIVLSSASTSVTPEPASLALVAFGMGAVAFIRRKRNV